MSLLNSDKQLVSIPSSHQDYARQHGFKLERLNDLEWGLSQNDEVIYKFPNQNAASQYIYKLEMEAVASSLS
jgi:hypothetical protein